MNWRARRHYQQSRPVCRFIGTSYAPIDVWAAMFGPLSPAGRHYEASHEAFALFSSLRSSDKTAALAHASELKMITQARGFRQAQEAVENLESALHRSIGCDDSLVHLACARAIHAMVIDGLINATHHPNRSAFFSTAKVIGTNTAFDDVE